MKINISICGKSGKAATAFKPLDNVFIDIIVRDNTGTGLPVEVRALDGNNQQYVSRRVMLQQGQSSVSFPAAGALGRHSVHVSSVVKPDINHTEYFILKATTEIRTDNQNIMSFFAAVSSLLKNLPVHAPDGKRLKGISWIRDHVHTLKGCKYWEEDIKGMVEYFLEHQVDDGSYYDFFEKEDEQTTFWRMDCEADLEYLMVEAVHTVWQVTGDDKWMFSCLDKIEKGLQYIFTTPKRWSKEYNLAKRPFTIDTWDFEYQAGDFVNKDDAAFREQISPCGFLQRKIDHRTRFCIMHGDNSGLFMACGLLAKMYDRKDEMEKKNYWSDKAGEIRSQANKICWNEKFYTHQVHVDPVDIPVDESRQLSLSNAYDVNRGLPSYEQAASIIREYRKRKREGDSFAEWFSIDPPFPNGVFPDDGGVWGDAYEYINGTVMPLVGGELARAAFEHGFERYGWDILLRLQEIISRDGKLDFMYNRDGSVWHLRDNASAHGGPSAWGDAAIIYAFIEGLAGIVDVSKSYQDVRVSPRWAVTGEKKIAIVARYAASDAYFAYQYTTDEDGNEIAINFTGSGDKASFHVLLPDGKEAKSVCLDNEAVAWKQTQVGESRYVDCDVPIPRGTMRISILKK